MAERPSRQIRRSAANGRHRWVVAGPVRWQAISGPVIQSHGNCGVDYANPIRQGAPMSVRGRERQLNDIELNFGGLDAWTADA